jgi:hypothetical protein
MQLQACAGCRRHVRVGDRACPFCGAAIGLGAQRARLLGKVSRAAVFAVGGASAAACWTGSSTGSTTTTTDQTNLSNKGSAQSSDELVVPAPSPGFASLAGICKDTNGQPVGGADVQVYSGTGRGGRALEADAQGRFYAKDLEPGSYGVQCRAPNDPGRAVPQTSHAELKAGDAKRVDGTVDHRDWSMVPMPYGAPPSRRRVV